MRQSARTASMPRFARAKALIRKETLQMLRDKSTLTLGVVLPIVLLLLFGFGLSLDVTLTPVAVVRDSSSPITRDLYASLKLSPYFAPIMADSWEEAQLLLRTGKINAIVRRNAKDNADGGGHIQILVNGRDSNQARIMQRYIEGALAQWSAARRQAPSGESGVPPGTAVAEPRIWFNLALESRHFLIPGVTALIMTLIGSLLTALVVAREWERGTYEAMAATPVKEGEIIAGKTIPYFALGMLGLSLCLAAARFVFDVPIRGSLVLLVLGSALYLLMALGLGLFVSAAVKSQFIASQIVLVFCFLPTLMLSGFVFDLQSAPRAVFYIAHAFPATWYVELLQTLFLAGNVTEIVVRDFLVMGAFAALMLCLARKKLKKSLE